MCVAPEAGGNKVFVYLRLFGKAKEAFPDFAAFLLPKQPAPKFTAGKLVLADAVALNQAFSNFQRYTRTFAVYADIGQITLLAERYAHYAVAAQLVGFHFIDKTGGIAGHIKAQGFQKPVVKSVQLKADAAAVVHDNFIEHILSFERGNFAV